MLDKLLLWWRRTLILFVGGRRNACAAVKDASSNDVIKNEAPLRILLDFMVLIIVWCLLSFSRGVVGVVYVVEEVVVMLSVVVVIGDSSMEAELCGG